MRSEASQAVKTQSPDGLFKNILFVMGSLRDADFIEHEFRVLGPTLHLDVSPKADDALARLGGTARYDALVIDTELPEQDCVRLISHVRQNDLPMAIILLLEARLSDPPLWALEAGADDYVIKRAKFTDRLYEVLQQAFERDEEERERTIRPLKILVAGDFEGIRQHLGDVPYLYLDAAALSDQGILEGIAEAPGGRFPYDLVLIDDSITLPTAFQALKEVRSSAPDVPVALLVEPANEERALQAFKLGATDCVVKTGHYYERLVPLLRNLVHLRELARERRALRSTETRLRILIETVPAAVTVLSRDGVFMALNRAGLPLMGAVAAGQLVGKRIDTLVSGEEQERLKRFLEGICAGSQGAVQFACTGIDGVIRQLELRAVPLRREPQRLVTALGVLRETSSGRGGNRPRPSGPFAIPHAGDATAAGGPAEASSESAGEKPSVAAAENQAKEPRSTDGSAESARRVLSAALQVAESRLLAQAGELRVARQRLEQDRLEFEQRRESLEQSVRAAEARLAELSRQSQAREEELERARQEAEQRLAETQEALQSETARLAQAEEQLRLTNEGMDASGREFERQRGTLEEALRAAEARLAELSQQSQTHEGELERARQEAEQQLAQTQEALQSETARLAQVEEQLRLTNEGMDASGREFERQRGTLEEALRAAEARLAALSQQSQTHEGELERARQEAERRFAETQELLQSETGLLARAGEELRRERERMEETRRESDRERTALEEALRAAEDRLADQSQEFLARQEDLLRALEAAERRLGDTGESLQSETGRASQAEDELRREREQMAEIRRQFDQQRTALEESLRAAEARMAQQSQEFLAREEGLERDRGEAEQRLAETQQLLQSETSRLAEVEEALRAAEARLAELLPESQAREGEVERARRKAEQRLTEAQALLQSETARLVQAQEELRRERATTEEGRLKAEQERTALEEALRAAESRLALQTAAYQAERATLEAGLRDAVHRVEALERSLESKESRLTDLSSAQPDREAEFGRQVEDLEQQQIRLADALQATASRLAKEEEDHRAQVQDWSRRQAESEQRIASLEEMRRTAELRLEQQVSAHRDQLVGVLRRKAEVEQECAALAEALRAAEARTAHAMKELQAQQERSRFPLVQAGNTVGKLDQSGSHPEAGAGGPDRDSEMRQGELEQARQEIERERKARAGVEATVREWESACNKAAEQLKSARSRCEELQREIESCRAERERLRTLLNETTEKHQELLRQQATSMQELLSQAVARLQQDADARLQLAGAQHRQERESLERLLQETDSRLQRLRKQREAERWRRRRLESLARLATATIQTFNDLMRTLGAHEESLLAGIDKEDPRRKHGEAIRKAVTHAGGLGRYLLAISRRLEQVPGPVDLNATVQEMKELLCRLLGDEVEVFMELADRLDTVAADRREIEQMLTTIAVDARHSLPAGGVFRIRTSKTELEQPDAQPRPCVLLTVGVTGYGAQPMSASLALEGLVSRCGGQLRVTTDAEAVSVVAIYLPRAEDELDLI